MSPELVHNSTGHFSFIDGDNIEKIDLVYTDDAGHIHKNIIGNIRLHEVMWIAAQGQGVTYKDIQIKLLMGEKTIHWE